MQFISNFFGAIGDFGAIVLVGLLLSGLNWLTGGRVVKLLAHIDKLFGSSDGGLGHY